MFKFVIFFQAVVNLSWKPAKPIVPAMAGSISESNGAQKRHTPISFDSPGGKSQKGERQIYVPPRNKFSSVSGQFSES